MRTTQSARQLHALEALARLAAETSDPVGAASEAARLAAKAVGSDDLRLLAGDGVNFQAYPPRKNEDFFGMTADGQMALYTELMRLGRAAVFSIGGDGVPQGIRLAEGESSGTHVGIALGTVGASVIGRGPWCGAAARRAGRFLEMARPGLAMAIERVVDVERGQRVQQHLNVLSNVAQVFTRAKEMPQVLQDVSNAINSATGLLASIDVLDSRGRIIMRTTGASRFAGTPLHESWLKMAKGRDPIRQMILKDPQPVELPDLQNDPRISEAARQFYRRAGLVCAVTLPLVFQDEVVGLLRTGSLKPGAFSPPVLDLVRDLAGQVAVVVKGIQLWEEVQRSRKQIERFAAKLQASMEIQHHLARIDHLCGVPNRRYLDEVITAECARADRHSSRLSLAMADLDDFKTVNDTYGHAAGDEVLQQVAAMARNTCRRGDIAGRMGGDEFLFVLPGADLQGAVASADRFRRKLETTAVPLRSGKNVSVTASIGVVEAERDSLADPRLLVSRVDDALYEAKSLGKNTIRWYEPLLAQALA